ncbi:hypothetical protein BaRGS_00036971 [Batillaria attramentaria]|uniref:Uncharacterized protein n=1 Tax=Batillaria attramentaria TaxID=370345 RepID=A0ABD0J9Y2_9CAEN
MATCCYRDRHEMECFKREHKLTKATLMQIGSCGIHSKAVSLSIKTEDYRVAVKQPQAVAGHATTASKKKKKSSYTAFGSVLGSRLPCCQMITSKQLYGVTVSKQKVYLSA